MLNGLCMDHKPSLSDIARIAGVTKPTVSIVLNGKGDKGRICRDTQSRIRAVARDLGYQKQSTMPVPMPDAATGEPPKMVGLLLSTASPASTLALIPGRDSTVSMEGCRLVVVTLPQDPTTARARVASLIQEGFVSFICCPTVYTVAASTSTVPVTKLAGGEVAELSVVELLRKEPVVATPALPPVVAVPPVPPPVVAPEQAPVTLVVSPQVQPQQPPETSEPAPIPAPISEPSPTPPPLAEIEPDPVVEDTPVAVADEEPPTATEPPMEEPAPEEPVETSPVMPEPEPVSPVPAEPVVTVIPTPEVIANPLPQAEQPRPADGSEPIPDDPVTEPKTPDAPASPV